MSTTLHWQTSDAVSAFYAAAIGWRQPDRLSAALAAALGEPLEILRGALADERVPAEPLWQNLFAAVALGHHEPRRLAEVTLTKTMGQVEASPRVGRFERALRALRQAMTPLLDAPNLAGLQTAWRRHGAALLQTIAQLTEPEVLVDEATVVGVPPIQDGGGLAVPSANVALVEATESAAEHGPAAFEAIRLAWLIAQLQLDLPRYSDHVPAARRAPVGAAAMLPAALEAARRCRMTELPLDELLERQGTRWLTAAGFIPPARGEIMRWWSVYQSRRPPLGTALQALI
jgi:hypothetical protein